MQTVAQNTTANKFPEYALYAEAQSIADYRNDRQRHTPAAPITHRATYHALEGVAMRTAGGWTFLGDGSADTWLVSSTDADLVLCGRTDLADAQRAADDFAGGLAAIVCGRR